MKSPQLSHALQFIVLSLCFGCFIISPPLSAQVQLFKTLGHSGNDFHGEMIPTDGGYIIAGTEGSGYDVSLIKVDEFGNTLWSKTYGGSGWERGYAVIESATGGYIVSGETDSYGAGQDDLLVFKTDSLGNLEWSKVFGGTNFDQGSSIVQTTDSNYVVVGYTMSTTASSDIYAIKIDANGTALWTNYYSFPDSEAAYSVAATPNNGCVITGTTNENYSISQTDVFAIRLDSIGNVEWSHFYGAPQNEASPRITHLGNDEYVIHCSSNGGTQTNEDILLIKINSVGDTLWTKSYGGTGGESPTDCEKLSTGGLIVSGSTTSFGANISEAFLLYISNTGQQVWTNLYGGVDVDGFNTVIESSTGFVASGTMWGYGAGATDLSFVRTNGLGVVQCYHQNLTMQQYYPVIEHGPLTGITSGVLSTESAITPSVTTTSKIDSVLCSSVSIYEKSIGTLDVYPNPSNGKITVRSSQHTSPSRIKLFSVDGSLVYSKQLNVSNENIVDIGHLKDGLYVYEFVTELNERLTGRIVLSR